MSIAVSVTVQPSRLLLLMVWGMCSGAAAIGIAICFGYPPGLPFGVRFSASAFSFFSAVFGFCHGIKSRKPIHIDILGNGQFRLSEAGSTASCVEKNRPHLQKNSEVVRLLGNTTIWPHLLLLRFQDDNGKITILPILPDCVSRDSFRALSVACRWVTTRGDVPKRGNIRNIHKLD